MPLTCPVCPGLTYESIVDPCYFPNATCNFSAYMPGGSSGMLPCDCNLSSISGNRGWSCAIP